MVGSQVVFEQRPNKNEYRKYKIRTVLGQSDGLPGRESFVAV